MKTHLETQCKQSPFRNVDKTQTTLGFKPTEDGSSGSSVVLVSFSAEDIKEAIAKMLIIDELPLKFVENEGFRKLMLKACPKFYRIPNRITMAKLCNQVYLRENKKLKSALRGQRVCLTTDTWTSLQNLNYLSLTAHFINCDWRIQKKGS